MLDKVGPKDLSDYRHIEKNIRLVAQSTAFMVRNERLNFMLPT